MAFTQAQLDALVAEYHTKPTTQTRKDQIRASIVSEVDTLKNEFLDEKTGQARKDIIETESAAAKIAIKNIDKPPKTVIPPTPKQLADQARLAVLNQKLYVDKQDLTLVEINELLRLRDAVFKP